MANSAVANTIADEIYEDVLRFRKWYKESYYVRATSADVKNLTVARRRLRLAMTRLSIEHGGRR